MVFTKLIQRFNGRMVHLVCDYTIFTFIYVSDCEQERALKWIVDVTIGYPDGHGIPWKSLLSVGNRPFKITVLYRIWHIDEVPKDEDKLGEWLREQWLIKEKMLDCYYHTGRYPRWGQQKTVTMETMENNNDESSDLTEYLPVRKIQWSGVTAVVVHLVYNIVFLLECVLIYLTIIYIYGILVTC